MKYCILFFGLLLGTFGYPSEKALINKQWDDFKRLHHKSYSELEEAQRIVIFKENLKKIEEHNKLYENGQTSYKMEINQFADMTPTEFAQFVNRFKNNHLNKETFIKTEYFTQTSSVPDEIDWRSIGAVGEVTNQGECGSSSIFSAVGSLEGQYFIKNRVFVSFSTQELMDCNGYNESSGDVFRYVIENGLSSAEDYPQNTNGTCSRDSIPAAVTQKSFAVVVSDNEEALKEVVGIVGPVSALVDVNDSWQFYSSGIFTGCDTDEGVTLNHEVLVVGYGAENDVQYWILRNSWGPSWGEEGYIRMARNVENNCGITSHYTYPIL